MAVNKTFCSVIPIVTKLNDMKGIIIYKGRYGATQQYAEWLGAALNLETKPAAAINDESLAGYDYLIIGASVYIGKLEIKKWLKKNQAYLAGKKIFVFQVAGTPPVEKEKRESYNNGSIPEGIMENCEFYFLPGRMNIRKLSWIDRFMLKMGARLTKDPARKKAMLTDYDNVAKEHLKNIISAVKKYTGIRVMAGNEMM